MADAIDLLIDQQAQPNIEDTEEHSPIKDEDIYTFMENAFDGTGGFRNGKYLVPHTREMFYKTRRMLAFYKNYLKPIVNATVIPVFNRLIARKLTGSSPAINAFREYIENADNAGTDLTSFMEDVMMFSRLHGVSFIVMDNFPEEEMPATAAEALENRIFPYTFIKKANQVHDFLSDRFGELERITFVDRIITMKIKGKDQTVQSFIRWTRDEIIKLFLKPDTHDLIEIDRRTHGLGEVPVIPVYTVKRQDKEQILVDPPMFDIAKLNHAIFNKDSEIREIERSQGFSVLYVQTDVGGNLTFGPNNVMLLPMDTSITPGFASPDPAIQKNLVEYGKELRDDVFRIAEQQGVTGVKVASSGIAMQWDFFAHESVLKKTSSVAQTTEHKIYTLFKLYFGETTTEAYEVHYPMSFQPNDKLQEIKIIDMYLMIDNLPPKAKAMALEHITQLLFSNKDAHLLEEVLTEIREFKEDEVQGRANQPPFNQNEDDEEEEEEEGNGHQG